MKISVKRYLILLIFLFIYGCSFVFDSAYKSKTNANNEILIAVLLPLSGANETLSKGLLQAVHLAYNEMNNPYITLKIYDIGTDANTLKQAVNFAIKDHVSLIIGPIKAEDTTIVANIIKNTNIVMLALSSDVSVLKSDSNIHTTAFLPSHEIENIIDYASVYLDSKKFAILVPENKYGDLVLATAKESLSLRKLEFVRSASYPADVVRLDSYVQKLIQPDELKKYLAIKKKIDAKEEVLNEEGQAIKRVPEPVLDFDTLIIGDYGKSLIIVSAHLPNSDINTKNIKILGNSLWDNLDNLRDNNLQNAYFASYNSDSAKTKLYSNYEELYSRKPNNIEASIMDAIILTSSFVYLDSDDNLVNDIVRSTKEVGLEIKYGVFGNFTLHGDGTVAREMYIKEIKNKKAETIANNNYKVEGSFNERIKIKDYRNLDIIENRAQEKSTKK